MTAGASQGAQDLVVRGVPAASQQVLGFECRAAVGDSSVRRRVEYDVLGAQRAAVGQDVGTLDDVAELAHIA
jgi:hypothetical protein